jgi:hypothetical protein
MRKIGRVFEVAPERVAVRRPQGSHPTQANQKKQAAHATILHQLFYFLLGSGHQNSELILDVRPDAQETFFFEQIQRQRLLWDS